MADAADYGIDAPDVIRNLFLAGAAGLLVWGTAALGLWSGVLAIPIGQSQLRIGLAGTGLGAGLACTATGLVMLYYSKVGKIRSRERLLDLLAWTGDETVLDVGCGRGLMLIGAAKRLTTGRATGIDIWQAVDLTGNRPESTLENARREGVADRVGVETADMRQLPFPDGRFTAVVSCAAIHNISRAEDRATAVSEIARVLAPGGQVLITDIRDVQQYERVLASRGCDVRRVSPWWKALPIILITWGAVRPGTVVARKRPARSMPDLPHILLFMAAGLALNLTPGPDMLYTIARSSSEGRRAGIASALGIGAGCFVHLGAVALGLSALLAAVPVAYDIVRFAGAAYLVVLGARMLWRPSGLGASAALEPSRLPAVFLQGVVTNVLNPKVALFFLAFLPQFVDRSAGPPVPQILLLGVLFNVQGTLVNLGVALAASRATAWLRARERESARLQRLTGAVFIALGARLAFAGRR